MSLFYTERRESLSPLTEGREDLSSPEIGESIYSIQRGERVSLAPRPENVSLFYAERRGSLSSVWIGHCVSLPDREDRVSLSYIERRGSLSSRGRIKPFSIPLSLSPK